MVKGKTIRSKQINKRVRQKTSVKKPRSTGELYETLPRLWRDHRIAKDEDVARFTLQTLRKWLRKQKGPSSKWCSCSDSIVTSAVNSMKRRRRIRQRLGFRFVDSKGSWGVENLKGFVSRPAGSLPVRRGEISWDVYLATFGIRVVEKNRIEISRKVEKEVVKSRVEKIRRADAKGSLGIVGSNEMITITAKSRRDLAASDGRRRVKVVQKVGDLLPAVVFSPVHAVPKWTLIYLHALGDHALTDYADKPHYFFDGTIAVKVIIPTAPSRELSCYDKWWKKIKRSDGKCSWTLTRFNSWYDYMTNYDGKREDEIDWASLYVVRRAVHSIIKKEARKLGNRFDRVIVGGKSQGCCTSLDAFLTFPETLGGFVGLVGHLLGCTPVESSGSQVSAPLHFFHEVTDHIMPWKWVQKGEQKLLDAGYKVHSRHCKDPQNTYHFIGGGAEGNWVRSALRSICCEK